MNEVPYLQAQVFRKNWVLGATTNHHASVEQFWLLFCRKIAIFVTSREDYIVRFSKQFKKENNVKVKSEKF